MYYIGISGEQGSGKDTVASMIQLQYPRRTEILSFSKPIKDIMRDIFKVNPETSKNTSCMSTLARGEFLLKRTLMQKIGSGFRSIYKDIFIDLLMLNLKESDKEIIVIPDIRYINEATFVKANGGMLIKIDSNATSVNTEHESEKEWHQLKFDIVMSNRGSKEDLYSQIREEIFPRIPPVVFKRTYEGWKVVKEYVMVQHGLISFEEESDILIEVPEWKDTQ